jgi:tRNA(adenine34) deaminase
VPNEDEPFTGPLTHIPFMREALDEAAEAGRLGEVPVGAVVVLGGTVIGRGHNMPVRSNDPTAHAEVLAIRAAAAFAGNYRLTGSVLYVTIEPCLMCVGAALHARVGTIVFGAPEPKAGALESNRRPVATTSLTVVSGVLASECRAQLQRFFQGVRS